MYSYSLKFVNPLLEAHYQHKNLNHQRLLFSTFLIFQFCFLAFLAVITMIKFHTNYDHITLFSVSAFFLFILYHIRFRWSNLFKIGLQIFFLGFGMVLTEMALLIRISDNWLFSPETIAFIIPIQSFCSLMLLVRLNWMLASLIYLINIIYFMVRMMEIQNHEGQFYIWVGLFMGVLNFSYMAFREQKIYRELFKNTHDSYETLNFYHLLMRNVLPSSIFILNYDKSTPNIEFINFQALKLMSKTLGDSYFFEDGNCIDCSLNFPKHCKECSFPKDNEVDYEKIIDFFSKMSVMDQHFELYQNNIPRILADYFHSKKQDSFHFHNTEESNKEIQFMNINLSKTVTMSPFPSFHEKSRKHGDFSSSEYNLLKKDLEMEELHHHGNELENKIKYYELKGAKIKWKEKDCLLVLISDITKSKKIIELKNLDKHKNELLASISHDLRTPLNGVIGMLNATIGELREEKHKEYLNVALRSANLLDFLIKDILDFSQMSYKQLRLNIEEFDIKIIVQEVISLMKFQARARPISLELDSRIPERLNCKSDPNRLKQILINLLGNAIKFTKQGFVKLRMEFIFDQERKLIKFSVSDTGIGIRKEDQPKLFRLFGKLNQEDPEINKHGIGLGLAISHSLAKLLAPHKEDSGLHVESCFGQGSTFWFYIDVGSIESPMKEMPFLMIDETSTGKEGIESPIKQSPITKNLDKIRPLVLIVDDDMVNLFVLEKYLENFSIDVIKATNGVEAVDVVEREVVMRKANLALILMDCHMPLMNGMEATKAIMTVLEGANKEKIPIVGISANDCQEEIEKCIKAGMIKFIGKPIKREEFYRLVEGFIGKERV